MKVFSLIILYFFTANVLLAQAPTTGAYYTNNYINKFEGDWQWTNGTDTVLVRLKKVKFTFGSLPYYEDVIIGCHKYIRNGQLIENSLSRWDSIVQTNSYKRATILGLNHQYLNDTSKIECSMRDIAKYKNIELLLQFLPTAPTTLIWTLTVSEGLLVGDQQGLGITLPTQLILTKQ